MSFKQSCFLKQWSALFLVNSEKTDGLCIALSASEVLDLSQTVPRLTASERKLKRILIMRIVFVWVLEVVCCAK